MTAPDFKQCHQPRAAEAAMAAAARRCLQPKAAMRPMTDGAEEAAAMAAAARRCLQPKAAMRPMVGGSDDTTGGTMTDLDKAILDDDDDDPLRFLRDEGHDGRTKGGNGGHASKAASKGNSLLGINDSPDNIETIAIAMGYRYEWSDFATCDRGPSPAMPLAIERPPTREAACDRGATGEGAPRSKATPTVVAMHAMKGRWRRYHLKGKGGIEGYKGKATGYGGKCGGLTGGSGRAHPRGSI